MKKHNFKEIVIKVNNSEEIDTVLNFFNVKRSTHSLNLSAYPNYIFLQLNKSVVYDYCYLSDNPLDLNDKFVYSIMKGDSVYEKIFTINNLYIIKNLIKYGVLIPSYEPKKIKK